MRMYKTCRINHLRNSLSWNENFLVCFEGLLFSHFFLSCTGYRTQGFAHVQHVFYDWATSQAKHFIFPQKCSTAPTAETSYTSFLIKHSAKISPLRANITYISKSLITKCTIKKVQWSDVRSHSIFLPTVNHKIFHKCVDFCISFIKHSSPWNDFLNTLVLAALI